MRFSLNVLISCPLKPPRLEAFDFNSFAVIRARATRRVPPLHSETNEELEGEVFNSPNAHGVPVFSLTKVHSYTAPRRHSVLSHRLLHCEQFILAPS